jgi:acyl carrier protein
MNKNEIIESVKKILTQILNHENFEIKEGLSATEVEGWDSLSHILIITEVEKKFNIRFKLRELNNLDSVGNLIELIHSKTA